MVLRIAVACVAVRSSTFPVLPDVLPLKVCVETVESIELLTLLAPIVVAIPLEVTSPVKFPVKVADEPEALPVREPTKVVVVKEFVDGLKLSPVPKLKGWFELEEDAAKMGKKDAFEEVETVDPFVEFVAVVAVEEFPERAADIVPAEKFPDPSLFTTVLIVFEFVAAFAITEPEATLAAL